MLFTSNALKMTSLKIIQENGLLLNVETGSQKLAILSYAGLRSGNCSDLDSACLKVLVPVKIFQI